MDFAEIADFDYSDAVVDNDIRICLMTGDYHPSYREKLKAFLAPELVRLQFYVTDFNHCCHFVYAHAFHPKNLKKFISDDLNIKNPARQKSVTAKIDKEFAYNLAAGYVFSVPDQDGKKQIVVMLGETEDPLYSIYNTIHECMHALQQRRLYAEYFDKIERQAWIWRDQGYSEDKIERVLKATNFNYEKVGKISRTYSEIQANVGAAVYMMAQALKSNKQTLIDKVENFVMAKSSSMSNALINSGLGVAYCDFPVTRQLIGELKKSGADLLFDSEGCFNWDKLYQWTSAKTKDIGYTPHMIMDADKIQGAFLRNLQKNYPEGREMLNVLKWCPEYKTDKILQDFASAQEVYLTKPGLNLLKNFHSRLANPLERSDIIFKDCFDNIPNIDNYRQIYRQNQQTKMSVPQH